MLNFEGARILPIEAHHISVEDFFSGISKTDMAAKTGLSYLVTYLANGFSELLLRHLLTPPNC